MALRYEEVDTDDGTARFVGSSGRTDVAARFVRDALTFIHSGTDGSVALTTVSRSTADGKWLAVHTRHEFTETSSSGVTLGPAQYYGTCTIER
jgi:tRNA pseudouridine-54 N-methylase